MTERDRARAGTYTCAPAKLRAMPTPLLVDMYEDTSRRLASPALARGDRAAIADVRGWLLDELEHRDADAFLAWIDSDQDSPRPFFA